MSSILASVLIGCGATVLFDLWARTVSRMRGAPPPAWGLPGRWFANVARGRVVHASIAAAPPVTNEALIGWIGHYAVGVAFAGVVVAWGGQAWLAAPTLGPPLFVGVATVLLGWLVMSPGMGNGIAAARAPAPWTARGLGLAAHVVFGLAMWVCSLVLAALG
jgi:hypothetical protein